LADSAKLPAKPVLIMPSSLPARASNTRSRPSTMLAITTSAT
jgi:hypothetical protein